MLAALLVSTLLPVGQVDTPPATHNVNVYEHGHRLVKVLDTPPDGCGPVYDFLHSRNDLRVVAVWDECLNGVFNFTHRTLRVHAR